ncbi:hypothetical protein HCN44_000337 [Aphidius gifuensis]|uniref:Uncharacterized protein n=1 Tax=Aphidius gifuensis TaxID=684658 RepID=A0A834XRV7_APHGI|nr:hypothetical protein HCN44_000336 [Aphidius gifuensis]KAF7990532.1 hypothetical protein HCN44_000337 [Aphidius gifuensis]
MTLTNYKDNKRKNTTDDEIDKSEKKNIVIFKNFINANKQTKLTNISQQNDDEISNTTNVINIADEKSKNNCNTLLENLKMQNRTLKPDKVTRQRNKNKNISETCTTDKILTKNDITTCTINGKQLLNVVEKTANTKIKTPAKRGRPKKNEQQVKDVIDDKCNNDDNNLKKNKIDNPKKVASNDNSPCYEQEKDGIFKNCDITTRTINRKQSLNIVEKTANTKIKTPAKRSRPKKNEQQAKDVIDDKCNNDDNNLKKNKIDNPKKIASNDNSPCYEQEKDESFKNYHDESTTNLKNNYSTSDTHKNQEIILTSNGNNSISLEPSQKKYMKQLKKQETENHYLKNKISHLEKVIQNQNNSMTNIHHPSPIPLVMPPAMPLVMPPPMPVSFSNGFFLSPHLQFSGTQAPSFIPPQWINFPRISPLLGQPMNNPGLAPYSPNFLYHHENFLSAQSTHHFYQ